MSRRASTVLLTTATLVLSGRWHPLAAQQPTGHDTTPGMAMPGTAMPGMATPAVAAGARRDTGMTAATMDSGVLGIPMTRTGSGTSWLPDSTPMYAHHIMAGGWELMLHGNVFLQEDRQLSRRGSSQFGSVNWGMLMAQHNLAGGRLSLRGMMSAEPWTVGGQGYPLLLQTGETWHGQPLHDRQHPHDLFMELAALYDHPIARNLAVLLYVAPVGEPALGPVAFPHRPSAMDDPLAPIGHHWQDATHISFGVITAGIYTRMVKVEGSIFNGREPDEIRTNFDYKGRSLDSYSGRVTVNPDPHWSLAGSYGYLKSPEAIAPQRSLHRMTASAMNARSFGRNRTWNSTLIYGANKESGESHLSNSVLAESDLRLDRLNTVFGRMEWVQKSAADLVLPTGNPLAATGFPPDEQFGLQSYVLGYVREIGRTSWGSLGLGARGSVNAVPEVLRSVYGTRTPTGIAVFLRLRPRRMNATSMSGMAGMTM